MFKIEGGSASLPPIESLKKFIPDMDSAPEGALYPLNDTWAHHGANDYYKLYDAAIRRRFGEPESIADYCWKAHLVTADQHRAMFEAVHHLKWDVTSGFMQWKLNSCWPDIQWQLYDYYLRPMVSFYYIKKACEPLHVQLNPINNMITVINNQLNPQNNLKIKARLFKFDMTLAWEYSTISDMPADCYKDAFSIPYFNDLTPVYFVKLIIEDENGLIKSENFYWLSSKAGIDDTGCFFDLKKLPYTAPKFTFTTEENKADGNLSVNVKLTNDSDKLAFFIRVILTKGKGGEEVLPVYWDDNYFSILPGETKNVTASVAQMDLDGAIPFIKTEGWNMK
jgi:exo-1,4-beta-D-glucosaminidase